MAIGKEYTVRICQHRPLMESNVNQGMHSLKTALPQFWNGYLSTAYYRICETQKLPYSLVITATCCGYPT